MSTRRAVALGQFGPAAVRSPEPVQLGPPVGRRTRFVSLMRASAILRLFVAGRVADYRRTSLVTGVRADFYRVTTEATPGYDVASVVAGARAGNRPGYAAKSRRRFLHTESADRRRRLSPGRAASVSPFVRYGRSYRHPNLEEMFFAGPATTGSIAPNVKVKPETGH